MTLHTAKGLEFPVVFLTGLEDGTFPHQRSFNTSAELAEERRLAYVGLTRARQKLFLSRAETRSMWGQPTYNPPSRFLSELGDSLVDWESTGSLNTSGADRAFSGAWSPGSRSGGAGSPANGSGASGSRGGRRGGARAGTSPGGFPNRIRPNREVPQVEPGDKVSHDSFGLGTVVEVAGAGDKTVATVDFGSEGTKRLLMRYAPVEKIS